MNDHGAAAPPDGGTASRPDDGGDAGPVRLEEPADGHARGGLLEDVGARLVDLGEERLPHGLADGHPAEDDVGDPRQLALQEAEPLAQEVLVGERLVLVRRVRLGDERVDRGHDLRDAAEPPPLVHGDSVETLGQAHDVAHVLVGLRGQPHLQVELQPREAAGEDEPRLLVEHRVGDLLVDEPPQPLVAGLGRDRERALALPGEDLEDRVLDRVDLDGRKRDVVPERGEALEDRDDLGVVADGRRDQARPVASAAGPRARPSGSTTPGYCLTGAIA